MDGQGKLTAVGIGDATITATSHNGLTEMCIVSVTAAADKIVVSSHGIAKRPTSTSAPAT